MIWMNRELSVQVLEIGKDSIVSFLVVFSAEQLLAMPFQEILAPGMWLVVWIFWHLMGEIFFSRDEYF